MCTKESGYITVSYISLDVYDDDSLCCFGSLGFKFYFVFHLHSSNWILNILVIANRHIYIIYVCSSGSGSPLVVVGLLLVAELQ